MSKKKLLCIVMALCGAIGCGGLFPQYLPVMIIAVLLLILFFILNRSAVRKLLRQKKPFEIGGKIRNVDYLIIGDFIDPASVVPTDKTYVQIKAPNRSLTASFEILRHTSSILDEDHGNVIIAVKNINKKKPYSVFDIPFLYDLTMKKLGLGKMNQFANFPLLVNPLSTIKFILNYQIRNWKESSCPDKEIDLFCEERNINLKYFE